MVSSLKPFGSPFKAIKFCSKTFGSCCRDPNIRAVSLALVVSTLIQATQKRTYGVTSHILGKKWFTSSGDFPETPSFGHGSRFLVLQRHFNIRGRSGV